MINRLKRIIQSKVTKRIAQGSLVLGVSVGGLLLATQSASAALYVTGPGGASAQLTANFNGGTSCVRDTSNNSYVTLRAYNSLNQQVWVIQDNTNNGVSVCAYTQGGVHHLIAYLVTSVPNNVKTWRANSPSSSWFLNSCYPSC